MLKIHYKKSAGFIPLSFALKMSVFLLFLFLAIVGIFLFLKTESNKKAYETNLLKDKHSLSKVGKPGSDTFLSDYHFTNCNTYKITLSSEYTNNSNKAENISLTMPLFQSQGVWQEVKNLNFSPTPESIVEDEYGNLLALYSFSNLEKGSKATVAQNAEITVKGIFANLNAEDIENNLNISSPTFSEDDIFIQKSSVDPIVKKASISAVKDETYALYKLLKIYDYLRGFNFSVSDKPIKTSEALKSGTLQCYDAALLLGEMASVQGFKARLASGFIMKEESPNHSEMHSWTEVNFPLYGYLPIDPTMGRMIEQRGSAFCQITPTYVTLYRGPSGFTIDGATSAKPKTNIKHKLTNCSQIPKENKNSKDNDLSWITEPIELNGKTDLKTISPMYLRDSLGMAIGYKDPQERAKALQQIFDKGETNSVFIEPLINAYYELGTLNLFRDSLLANKKGNNSEIPTLALGFAEAYLGNWSKAHNLLKGLPSSYSKAYAESILNTDTKQTKNAIFALKEASDQVVNEKLADLCIQVYRDSFLWKNMFVTSNKADMLFPSSDYYKICALQAAFRAGEDKEAFRCADQLIKKRKDGLGYAVLSLLYLERGDIDKCLPLIDKSIKEKLPYSEEVFFKEIYKNLKPYSSIKN